MDDAADLAAEVGLDRDDIAAVAQGDDGLLGGEAAGGGAEEVLQPGVEAVVGDADVAADEAECRAGGVDNVAALVDGAADFGDEAAAFGDGFGHAGEEGHRGLVAADGGLEAFGDLLRGGDLEQGVGVEHAAEGGLLEGRAHVGGAEEVQGRAQAAQGDGLGEEALAAQDLGVIGRGAQGHSEVVPSGEGGQLREAGKDLVVFEDTERVFIHGRDCSKRSLSARAVGWSAHRPEGGTSGQQRTGRPRLRLGATCRRAFGAWQRQASAISTSSSEAVTAGRRTRTAGKPL